MNQELFNYIQQAQARGETKENIIASLKTGGGWGDADIEAALRAVETAVAKPLEAKQNDQQQVPPIKKKNTLTLVAVLVVVLCIIGSSAYFFPNIKELFVHTTTQSVEETSTNTLKTDLSEQSSDADANSVTESTSSTASATKVATSSVSAKKETVKPVEKPVVQSVQPKSTSTLSIQRITVTGPGADWKKIELPIFHAVVSVPKQDMVAGKPDALMGSLSIEVSDATTTYFFEESVETYETHLSEAQKDLSEGNIPTDVTIDLLNVFTGQGLNDVFSMCYTYQSKKTCGGFVPKYDGRSLSVSCQSEVDEDMLCTPDKFYPVLYSIIYNPPPFVGVIGIDVPSLVSNGGDVTVPEGVKNGFVILDLANIQRLSVFGGGGVPKKCESGVCIGSPAEKAGLKSGDIITKVNGLEMTDFNKAFAPFKAGDSVVVTYLRDGKESTTTLYLTAWPSSLQ